LGFGQFLVGFNDLGTTGKGGRAIASESVIAVKTSAHGMQRRNYSGKATPILIVIRTGKHASHLQMEDAK